MSVPEGADPVQVASLSNPAMSSWMALRTKTSNLPKDFTVLIMGATSASGSIAIELSRHLGAGKVIGAARNEQKLAALKSLDEKIVLTEKVEETDFSTLGQVDVILDYVFGAATVHLLSSLTQRAPVQYVHIGGLSGPNIELPGSLLRSKDITIRGCGPGSWTFTRLTKELVDMMVPVAGLAPRGVKSVKLAEVEQRWGEGSGQDRVVYVP